MREMGARLGQFCYDQYDGSRKAFPSRAALLAGDQEVSVKVVYCFDRKFSPYAAVSTYSLLQSSLSEVLVYWCVPQDEIPHIEPLVAIANKSGKGHIRIVGVTDHPFASWKLSNHLSYASYLRLLIPDLIPEERVIYLDSDTLILGDLTPLTTVDLGPAVIGGVMDLDVGQSSGVPRAHDDPYVNAGVMVMKLGDLRRDHLLAAASEIYRKFEHQIAFQDQCVINKFAEGRKILFDPRWNRQIRSNMLDVAQSQDVTLPANTSILHFIGQIKPWQKRCNPVIANFWWGYAAQLNIEGLVPQDIASVEEALDLAKSYDLLGLFKEASDLKTDIINAMFAHYEKRIS